jgi:hypothetical protein
MLAAGLIAATVPLCAGAATAAPLSSPLALKSADPAAVETVQWRRGRGGRWIGPAAGFAAGVAIGGALSGGYGGDAYAYAPGYRYEAAPRYRYRDYRRGCSSGDDSTVSAYPTWACR